MSFHISFSKAVYGYSLAAQVRLSSETLESYYRYFARFGVFLGSDPPIEEITKGDVLAFLNGLNVSAKTVLNYHIGLSSLWHWALDEGLVSKNVVREVKVAKPRKKAIVPYSAEDIKAMLGGLKFSKPYSRPGKRMTSHKLSLSARNRAIILVLLDTGVRASELIHLKIHSADLRNRRIKVFGKGAKERMIPFSSRTGQALWKYLAQRGESRTDDFLFLTVNGNFIHRHDLRKCLVRVGNRAGVRGVTTHKFRHTFAINYLRNGGDPYSLQMMLGHSTMEMVKTYLNIAQADLDRMHKIASPVDNWRL